MINYQVGQIFEKTYSADVAIWCNKQNCRIKEITPLENGDRRFQIVESDSPTKDEVSSLVREKRNALLSASDFLVLPDYPISEEEKSAVLSYRQSLRDLTLQEGFPDRIVWPELPSVLTLK